MEDDENDAILLTRKLGGESASVSLLVAEGGDQAITYLTEAAGGVNLTAHPKPDLLLLDIRMPTPDGFDVLKFVRAHPVHHDLPAVVLSSSDLAADRCRAEELGADGYLVKDLHFIQVRQMLDALARAWMDPQLSPPAPATNANFERAFKAYQVNLVRHKTVMAESMNYIAQARTLQIRRRMLTGQILRALESRRVIASGGAFPGRDALATPPPAAPRALIVESNPVLLKALQRALAKCGLQVVTAANRAEGLRLLEQATTPFGIVVSALRFDHDTGNLDYLHELCALAGQARLLVTSGHILDDAEARWLDQHNVCFLPKPYDLPELLAALELPQPQ